MRARLGARWLGDWDSNPDSAGQSRGSSPIRPSPTGMAGRAGLARAVGRLEASNPGCPAGGPERPDPEMPRDLRSPASSLWKRVGDSNPRNPGYEPGACSSSPTRNSARGPAGRNARRDLGGWLPAPLARALALLVLGRAGGSCTPRGSIRFTRDPRGTRHSAPPQQAQDTTDLFLGRGDGGGPFRLSPTHRLRYRLGERPPRPPSPRRSPSPVGCSSDGGEPLTH